VGSRRQADVAAWCTTFDTTTTTTKQIWPGEPEAALLATPGRFQGAASAAGHEARWDLTVEASAAAVRPMSPDLLYRLPLPRTKVELPVPAGTAHGHVEVDGRHWQIDAWPATVGHNWGSEHAEQWLWLHALDVGAFRWVELIAARIRVGGVLSAWTATGVAAVGDGVHRLAGLTHPPSVRTIAPDRADLQLSAGRVRLAVTVTADPMLSTVLTYRDPRGGTRTVAHSGLAALTLTLRSRDGRTARHAGMCAFEVGSQNGWPGLLPRELPLEPV
jgi:hypothetical protein